MNWPTKKLGEIAKVGAGQPAPQGEQYFSSSGIPFVRVQDIAKVNAKIYLKNTKDRINILAVKKLRLKIIDKGAVIFTKSGVSTLLNQRAILAQPSYLVSHIGYALPKSGVTSEWLYLILKLVDFRKLSHATTLPSLRLSVICDLEIPVPSLKIQEVIVKRLDAIKKAQELNDKQISLAEELFQSLLEKESDPRGKEWETKRLGEVAIFKRGPFGGSLKKEIFVEHGYKVYEQKNAIYNDFTLGNYFINEEKYREMVDFAIHKEDLIVSCSGTIGKVAKVPADVKPGVINQALLKITPLENLITSDYLKFILETISIQRQLTANSRGVAIQNVASVKEIKRIKLPLPSLKIQHQIVKKFQAVQKYKKKLLEQKELLQELFESTLNKAMKGELVK